MKFVHLSDLHLGKRLHETSLIEDQEAILMQIIEIIEIEKPNGVLIAGDIYDKSVPSAEAVQLFDYFLVELAKRKLEVFVISGNHDSPERIAFGSKIMDVSGVHLSPVYNGDIKPVTLKGENEEVDVYMLPFIKPSHVRRFYGEEEISSYTDAVRVAIEKMHIDKARNNVLVTHQFVTGATRSESEESVGGTDNVDANVFVDFDYVALGHLHKPQFCATDKIRYSGTPLKYSFSEMNDTKSVTIVTLAKKGEKPIVKTVELKPIREMKRVCGRFDDLINEPNRSDDYVQIVLTDEDDVANAMSRLQIIYKNALDLKYDNKRTRENEKIFGVEDVERKTAFELFSDFFMDRNNAEMSEKQNEYVKNLIEKIEEEEV